MSTLHSINFRVDTCTKLDQNEQIPMALVEIISTTNIESNSTNTASNKSSLRLQFDKDQLNDMNDKLNVIEKTLLSIK